MNQISSMYAYGIPQADGYCWGQSTKENGFTYGAQPSSGDMKIKEKRKTRKKCNTTLVKVLYT
jgi:hypothetical protein